MKPMLPALPTMKVAVLTTDNREHFKDYSSPAPYFGTAPEALLQGFKQIRDVEIHVLSCIRQPVVSPPKLESNIFFHSLLVRKPGWMTTLYQGCSRAIRACLREIGPQLVHGQGSERECAMGAVVSGFPNVVTIHGNMAELARLAHSRIGSYGWLAARLETFALRRTAGVFCNSEYTERLVRPRARRTWRVPNAIREQFFSAAPSHARSECILLNVGFICPRKRQLELLEVAKQLRQAGLEFKFHFIGHIKSGDPYGTAFLAAIKPMEKEGFARYLGPKNTNELIECYDKAAGLVHFPFEEAFGLVVAEALARDVKLFGSRTGGIQDIASGVPGTELLEVNDFAGLTSGIAAWIRQGFPRAKGPAAAMRARYHPAVVAQRHLELYNKVLNMDKQPPIG